jgi:hypothetical protein
VPNAASNRFVTGAIENPLPSKSGRRTSGLQTKWSWCEWDSESKKLRGVLSGDYRVLVLMSRDPNLLERDQLLVFALKTIFLRCFQLSARLSVESLQR